MKKKGRVGRELKLPSDLYFVVFCPKIRIAFVESYQTLRKHCIMGQRGGVCVRRSVPTGLDLGCSHIIEGNTESA